MNKILVIMLLLFFISCSSTKFIVDDVNDLIKLKYKILKVDTLSTGLYDVKVKNK